MAPIGGRPRFVDRSIFSTDLDRMRNLWLIAAALVVLASQQHAWAWNEAGHFTTARIAWEQLSPAERHRVAQVLRQHPHFEQLLLKGRPQTVSEDEWAFLRAATWSDQIRPPRNLPADEIATHPIHRFHRGPWHYVNFAYHAGQTESKLPHEPLRGEGANATNILEQLEQSTRVLTDRGYDDAGREKDLTYEQNRAVRLCWLFHLVGDLHQPLHAATLIDKDLFPQGQHSDQGGNLIVIRAHIGAPPYKLHAFWDDRLGTDSHFPTIHDLAEALTHDPHLSVNQLPELREDRHFKDWAGESYEAAKTVVYRDGELKFAKSADFDQHKITADEVPILPQGAEAAANKLARRRVTLAGYRLAAVLKATVLR
jgi:hypothetical protein